MSHSLTPEARLRQMTETPIPRLLFTLSTPTIISMLISALYNMADTYFVGLIGNPSATGAVGVCLPLMAIIQAVGFTFGQGSGNFISRALGARDHDDTDVLGYLSALHDLCSDPKVFQSAVGAGADDYLIDGDIAHLVDGVGVLRQVREGYGGL